jgi:hypothetical protein
MSDGMITQTYSLDLVPGGNQLVVNVSQYDKLGRLLVFNLYQAGLAYSIPSGTGATIKGTKPDSKGFDYAMTVGNGKVSISVPQQMTAVAGNTICEVMLTDSAGNTISTANFILSVEHAAMDDATVVSDSDIPVFEGLVAQATTQAANASASASKAATSATASANSASASASSATKAETAYNNTKPLIPTNTGAVGQVLTKTSSGSQWETEVGGGLTNKEVLDLVRPVGSYFETDSATSPSTLWPWTTWEQVKDRFLVGAGNLYAVGSTGGEATVTLSESQIPINSMWGSDKTIGGKTASVVSAVDSGSFYGFNTSYGTTVSAHNNIPPYFATYMWRRTA